MTLPSVVPSTPNANTSRPLPPLEKLVFPSIEKVSWLAIRTLHIAGTAIFTLLCPYIGMAISSVIFISSLSILSKNKVEVLKQRQHSEGFDESTTHRALVAMSESIKIHKFAQATNVVCIIALAISSAVNPVWLVLATFFLTVNWVTFSLESKTIEQMKKTFDEQVQSTAELHKLERLYPEVFNGHSNQQDQRLTLLKHEHELREQKSQYTKRMERCVSKAWEDLLSRGLFTVQQGLQGDWNLFQPVCRMALIKELEAKKLNLPNEKIAPSLRKRILEIKSIKKIYSQLNKNEKREIIKKILTPEAEISSNLTPLVKQINSVADPMMQIQDLFQAPLIKGAEWYCMKKFKLTKLLRLQKEKLVNYGQKLFFKAEKQHSHEINHASLVENLQRQFQGHLVINGQRLPIQNIQLITPTHNN
jgi:hypothetical protein